MANVHSDKIIAESFNPSRVHEGYGRQTTVSSSAIEEDSLDLCSAVEVRHIFDRI